MSSKTCEKCSNTRLNFGYSTPCSISQKKSSISVKQGKILKCTSTLPDSQSQSNAVYFQHNRLLLGFVPLPSFLYPALLNRYHCNPSAPLFRPLPPPLSSHPLPSPSSSPVTPGSHQSPSTWTTRTTRIRSPTKKTANANATISGTPFWATNWTHSTTTITTNHLCNWLPSPYRTHTRDYRWRRHHRRRPCRRHNCPCLRQAWKKTAHAHCVARTSRDATTWYSTSLLCTRKTARIHVHTVIIPLHTRAPCQSMCAPCTAANGRTCASTVASGFQNGATSTNINNDRPIAGKLKSILKKQRPWLILHQTLLYTNSILDLNYFFETWTMVYLCMKHHIYMCVLREMAKSPNHHYGIYIQHASRLYRRGRANYQAVFEYFRISFQNILKFRKKF